MATPSRALHRTLTGPSRTVIARSVVAGMSAAVASASGSSSISSSASTSSPSTVSTARPPRPIRSRRATTAPATTTSASVRSAHTLASGGAHSSTATVVPHGRYIPGTGGGGGGGGSSSPPAKAPVLPSSAPLSTVAAASPGNPSVSSSSGSGSSNGSGSSTHGRGKSSSSNSSGSATASTPDGLSSLGQSSSSSSSADASSAVPGSTPPPLGGTSDSSSNGFALGSSTTTVSHGGIEESEGVRDDTSPAAATTSTTAPPPPPPSFPMLLAAAARPKRPAHPSAPPSRPLNPYSPSGAVQLTRARPLDCGEDAFFLVHRNDQAVFGVADGVGGWADLGVDPALFAWELMRNCRRAAADALVPPPPISLSDRPSVDDAAPPMPPTIPDPRVILDEAYQRLLREGKVTAGSATAAVLAFDMRTGRLRTANLGDSGYLIVRADPEPGQPSIESAGGGGRSSSSSSTPALRAVYRSPEQQHYFNAPFQLSVSPPHIRGNLSDSPQQAQVSDHQLRPGDVVIVATDGLFDNAFTRDILYTVHRELMTSAAAAAVAASKSLSPPPAVPGPDADPAAKTYKPTLPSPLTTHHATADRVAALARALAALGRELALNDRRQSPFARAASAISGRVMHGGKLDDVTVLAAVVVDAAASDAVTVAARGQGIGAAGPGDEDGWVAAPSSEKQHGLLWACV
ncbi:hypothetical protein BC828DRAFT_377911 [Blastocladiella britannica]|nr:hypothetical protein BC828DRAFT_377911 [Blastocladiella britannica]